MTTTSQETSMTTTTTHSKATLAKATRLDRMNRCMGGGGLYIEELLNAAARLEDDHADYLAADQHCTCVDG